MITHFSHRFAGLLPSFVFRVAALGATSIWLSLTATNVIAQTAQRPYQMSIIGTTEGSDIVDIPIFHYTHTQPAGRSIIWVDPKLNDPIPLNVDWMRIVAVYVDEPYNVEIPENGGSCGAYDVSQAIRDKRDKLRSMAAVVHAKAPLARFWVNFRRKDIELMRDRLCPLNDSYIDVISMDVYGIDFEPVLSGLYDYLRGSPPTLHQQLALVPGAFTGGPPNQSGVDGASRLTGFFDYANTMNSDCNLPLWPQGRTGIYDGCPVWLVAGFLGGTQPHRDEWGQGQYGPWHYPIDYTGPDSDVSPIRNKWQEKFAIPRVDPARVDRAIKAAPLLFND